MVLLALSAIEDVVMVVVVTMEKKLLSFPALDKLVACLFFQLFHLPKSIVQEMNDLNPNAFVGISAVKNKQRNPRHQRADNLVKTNKGFAWIREHVS